MNIVFEKGDRKIVLAEEDSHRMFLDLNGGGYNEDQTASAMEDRRAVLEGETITVSGVDIYTEEDTNV